MTMQSSRNYVLLVQFKLKIQVLYSRSDSSFILLIDDTDWNIVEYDFSSEENKLTRKTNPDKYKASRGAYEWYGTCIRLTSARLANHKELAIMSECVHSFRI
jgi:hypothetical protein